MRIVPSVEINEEMTRLARLNADYCLKEARKEMVRDPTFFEGKDTFYIGFLGELAVRKFLGLPLIVKRYLDYGYDLEFKGQKIDVKTSLLHRCLEQPVKDGFRVFVGTNEKLKDVDVIAFTKLEPDYSRVHLLGWIGREDLEKFPIAQLGNMPVPAYIIYFKYMEPFLKLK